MTDLGYTASTVEWEDGVARHDVSNREEFETVERDGYRVRAYRERPPSIDDLFADAVAESPDREAVAFPEREARYTYADLDDRVAAVAAGLVDVGIGPGDVVASMITNRPAFVETFLACQRIGAVAAPINTRVSPRELDYLLEDSDPDCLVIEARFADHLDGVSSTPGETFVVGDGSSFDSYGGLLERGDDAPGSDPARDRSEHDAACILYTSGTTGRPKGCVASHFNLVNGAINYQVSFATGDGLRSLVAVPMFHVAGLVSNFLHTVWNAGTTVIVDEYDAEAFLRTLQEEAIEYILTVPTQYVLARETADPGSYDLSSWRIGAYGGAPMDEETIASLRESFPDVKLCDAYGTTETVGGLVTMCPDRYTDDRSETIGLPTLPVEVATVDENRTPLGPDAIGELAIRGPIVVDEYLHMPEETGEAFGDGWHFTGDLATIDEDGFVALKGRSKDKIVRGGENVYTLDVEEVLLKHENVLEASVTGFPDDVLGERVFAAVVPTPDGRLTEDELRELCEENLADYKVPDVFSIRSGLPRNPGGKVLKSELLPEPLRHGIRAGGSGSD